MPLRTMHTRLLLGGLGLLLAGLGVFFVVASQAVSADIVRDAEQRAERELNTVKWLIAHHGDFGSEQDFDDWIKSVGERLGSRITFVTRGTVIGDSMVPYADLPNLDDHSTRPEINAATTTEMATSLRYSDTLGKDMIYAALRLPPASGLPRGTVRVAVPVSPLTERIIALRQNFLILFIAVMAIGALLAYGFAGSLSRSVRAFADMTRDIGSGDFSRRIRDVPSREFAPLAESVNSMAERIEEHVAIIEDQKGQLRAMFEGLSEGVLVLDGQGRIESFNRALSLMHPDVAAYVGRTPLEANMTLLVQDAVDRMLKHPDSLPEEVEVSLSDELHLSVSVVPFRDQRDEQRLILMFHDVTEARKSERMLRDFVANASHQLRTPLTSIRGYAETLMSAPPSDPEQAKSFLETIERNARHMAEVVSSLLALAKSEQVKRTEPRAVDACAVLRQAAASLAPRAAKSKMRIEAAIPAEPVFVRADAESLLHVLHNLIDNAAKYGPEDTTISVEAIPAEDSVDFRVCDKGEGVPAQHRERIFERFFRVDENEISGDGSAGLGLAICRQIVENFGGRIEYLDDTGSDTKETCFRFTLKRTEPEPNT